MPTDSQFIDAARCAAGHWGIEPASVRILNRTENVVCDVEKPDGRHVVMRLHRPGYNSIDELRSEVRWVDSLRSAGLPVPSPVPTLAGDHYVGVAVGAEQRQVGVIEWVTGRTLGGILADVDDVTTIATHYGRVGELAAAIRLHHADWRPPGDFVRRRWDADGLVGTEPIWGRFWEATALTAAQRAVFEATRDRLRVVLGGLSVDGDRFGLIHADLHAGNVMIDGDDITVIDFDDSGYGWFAHELAVALHWVRGEPFFPAARDAVIAGYRRVSPLADDEVELIDTFLVVRWLMIIGWLDARPEVPARARFAELAAEAAAVCTRFLDGEWS